MQYSLFLKGIGIKLDDAIKFWKGEFEKAQINRKNFEKDYLYNIKHNYGQVGKQMNYTPYGCQKLTSLPMNGQHGCPYRTLSETALLETLKLKGIGEDQSKIVVQLSQKKEYVVACRMVFDILHPGFENEFNNHPNEYFKKSRLYFSKKSNEDFDGEKNQIFKKEYHEEKYYQKNEE